MTEIVDSKTTFIQNCRNDESPNSDEVSSNPQIFKTEITFSIKERNENSDEDEDLVILKGEDKTIINKSAYSKLHKSPSNRLSTASLGIYDLFRNSEKVLRAPQSKSRKTKKIASQIKEPKHFHFAQSRETITDETNKSIFDTNEDESEEEIPCVLRKTESVDTIHKIENELSNFIMDPKKMNKKRTNSFRKLFSVPFFGKDKKKKDKIGGENIPNSDCRDNYQNETSSNSFIRNTPQRHTVGCTHFKNQANFDISPRRVEEEPPPELIRQYANMHINKFNKIRNNFEDAETPHTSPAEQNTHTISHITKYIDTSSSTSSTIESGRQNTYQKAIIPLAELQQSKEDSKYRITRNDSLKRETPPRAQDTYQQVNIVKPKAKLPINSGRPLPNPYHYNINSDKSEHNRLLIAPSEQLVRQNQIPAEPKLAEIYGTVFDAIDYGKNTKVPHSPVQLRTDLSPILKSPRSPSLESSKLKLPPNREITPLQPRMRSPLPPSKVSTEKIIATELLKSPEKNGDIDVTKAPASVDSSCRSSVELLQDKYSTTLSGQFHEQKSKENSMSRDKFERNDQDAKRDFDQTKYIVNHVTQNETSSRSTFSNAEKEKSISCETSSPMSTLRTSSRSSMTISPSLNQTDSRCVSLTEHQSLNSIDTRNISTPSPTVELRKKSSNVVHHGSRNNTSPASPTKDEIRRSVEAYYWKEIKKIKEQEDYEIYLSHLHFSQNRYPEDAIITRRPRNMGDIRSRRSSSVPRNPRQISFNSQNEAFLTSVPIPEGTSLLYNPHGNNIYGYINPKTSEYKYFPPRNVQQSIPLPQKRGESYKPIFRRGSLSGNIPQPISSNKKVSFSNSREIDNLGSWPTRNGFTRSPPQRRLEKVSTNGLEDDVFLSPQAQRIIDMQSQIHYDNSSRNNYYSDNENIYGTCRQSDYGYRANQMTFPKANYNSETEAIYGSQQRYKTLSQQELENLRNAQTNGSHLNSRIPPRLTRHESIQLPESTYGYTSQYGAARRVPHQQRIINDRENSFLENRNRTSYASPRRDILITDNIYGQHVGYCTDFRESPYGYSQYNVVNNESSCLTKTKQVTVRNKVCDIYGKIHDIENMSGEVQATGVLMGHLQNPASSPTNFRRGTRLTASNNEMSRRQPNFSHYNSSPHEHREKVSQDNVAKGAPIRPLPPLPPTGKTVQNDKHSRSQKNASSSKKKRKS